MNTSSAPSKHMIPYGQHYLDEEDIQAIVRQMREGTLTQGAVIEIFERSVAQYVGAKYAVAVTSGTAALHLACAAAKLRCGPARMRLIGPRPTPKTKPKASSLHGRNSLKKSPTHDDN